MLKRRTRIFLCLITLLLLIIGAWIYWAVYVSTDSALSRAESFLFQRMTVAQMGEQESMRYFYVTNRQLAGDGDNLEDNFSSERESNLKFGFYDTRVEPTVGLGMFINPSEWFQTEEIRVKQLRELQRQVFIDQLSQQVQKSPRQSLLVVVHGFRERFPSALRKTAFLGHVLDINSPVLLFDWPGDQGSSMSGYRRARNLAIESGVELAKTLELIVREVKPEKLWLIANSMGGQVVASAFSELNQNPEFADAGYEFEDVVLTAPDVSREEFDTQFKQEINALTRDLTVYVSSNDRALVMSRIINRDTRLGESSLNPSMLDEASSLMELIDIDSSAITLVDVTPVNRTRNFHNFSLETPEFFDDLFLRLTNEKTPRHRLIYKFKTPRGANYWVLTPGR